MGFKLNPFTGKFDYYKSANPAGSDTWVQFNDGGAFGAVSGFTFDKTTGALKVPTLVDASNLDSVKIADRQLIAIDSSVTADWENQILYSRSSPGVELHWDAGIWYSNNGNYLDVFNNQLVGIVTVDWNIGDVTSASGVCIDFLNRNLWDAFSSVSIDWGNRVANDVSFQTSIDWGNRILLDNTSATVFDWETGYWYSSSSSAAGRAIELFTGLIYSGNGFSIDFATRLLYDNVPQLPSLDWENRQIFASDGSTVNLDWSTVNQLRTASDLAIGSLSLNPVSKIHIDMGTATASNIRFTAGATTGQTATDGFEVGITASGGAEIRQREAQSLDLYTSNILRAQWTSSGNLFLDGSSQARGGAGSAAVPFWGFTSSSDCGMYRSAGSTVGFSTSGTSRVLISNAGVWDFGDNSNFQFGTTTGLKLGTGTTQKLAFHNSTPVAQRAGAAQDAVATTAATNVSPFGFTTAAQADALVTLVNELRAAMVEKGLIKGSA